MPHSEGVSQAKAFVQSIATSLGSLEEKDLEGISPEKRQKIERALLKKEVMVGSSIIRQAEDTCLGRAGFVSELIRNADDNCYSKALKENGAPYISFDIYPDRLVFCCNEDGFTLDDVSALCSVDKGARGATRGSVRRSGAWFRSVFTIASKAHIESGDFSFSLRRQRGDSGIGMIMPIWEEPGRRSTTGTRITLHLHGASDKPERMSIHENIREQLDEVPDTILLFTKNIRRFRVTHHSEDKSELFSSNVHIHRPQPNRAIIRRLAFENGVSKKTLSHFQVTTHHATHLDYQGKSTYSYLEDNEQVPSNSTVALAFPLSDKEMSIVESQELFTLFPVGKAGFNFLTHADFVTDSSGRGLVEDGNSEYIISKCYSDADLDILQSCDLRCATDQDIVEYLRCDVRKEAQIQGQVHLDYALTSPIPVEPGAFFPWLWLDAQDTHEIPPPDWQRLLGDLGVDLPASGVDFALAMLQSSLDSSSIAITLESVTRLFRLYSHIQMQYASSQDRVAARKKIRPHLDLEPTEIQKCQQFFKTTLGIKDYTWHNIVPELVALDKLGLGNKAKMRSMYRALDIASQGLTATSIDELNQAVPSPQDVLKGRVLPIKWPNGNITLEPATTELCVIDRKNLQQLFEKKIKMLAFTLPEVARLRPFLKWTGLEERYLSVSVKATTSLLEAGATPFIRPNLRIGDRASVFVSVAVHFGSPRARSRGDYSKLYSILRFLEFHETYAISLDLSLAQDGVSHVVRENRPTLHMSDNPLGLLTIFLPRNVDDQDYIFSNLLPQRLFEWIMTDPTTKALQSISDEGIDATRSILLAPIRRLDMALEGNGIVAAAIESIFEFSVKNDSSTATTLTKTHPQDSSNNSRRPSSWVAPVLGTSKAAGCQPPSQLSRPVCSGYFQSHRK
ncbi:INO80 chromatin remodeling complex protein [Colletotrichum kahawae]|uniref:INO80 chromatin remodeling complex protein n=1 Tax=Colletotrichum kahawae TaxID=34407 RepID=A0AAD9YS50_COLKA|nr:INO80 chromatin remodeling complex protein [Colletotrichum kahawae]